ncbi:protein tyrosine phosphatase family protein [Burkholderia gladioli]|uniref:protein tyrosine phosphatase family protein n=2 Tax=Burkholderiaceae TaxID=119060 RepID=UPI00064B72A2|nr:MULTISPECIES: protein tyrosine phosphatase family protein [Burkholderia]MDA0574590.1 protein tyrosine phosphatase family protein [Burkholderia gladioli]MDA0602704.1 protein tyrosine phosphatase family protein [Burkholderia gladioli]NIF71396.1 hypothetical protein [Burkholderia sp. Ap-962]NIF91624.1 hypothetical protein [Burkholderia sp. Cy-637]CAG9197805.1 conserved hypothetical protein [Burkholderia gladioli]
MKQFGISNERWLDECTLTSGQPSAEQFGRLASEGVEVVIDLAPTDARYSIEDEAGLMQRLGIEYHFLPVDFKAPTLADFVRFCAVYHASAGRRRLVHCAANYRVSAFVAHYQMIYHGWTTEQADAWVADIWKMADYPVWERFVRMLRDNLFVARAA